MAIVPLPLPPVIEARALLNHLLEHGDVVGRDTAGRIIIQLAVDDWALEKLMTFDADAAELEDGGDDEPDADDEEDGPPVVADLVRPKAVRRGRRRFTSFDSNRDRDRAVTISPRAEHLEVDTPAPVTPIGR